MKIYKNRYIIALYDKDDELVTVLDNAAEFARYMSFSANIAWVTLNAVMNGKQKCVYLNGRPLSVYLIDMEDENDD